VRAEFGVQLVAFFNCITVNQWWLKSAIIFFLTYTGDVSRDITAMEMSIMSKLTEAVLQNAASLEVAVNLAAQLGRKTGSKIRG
jgi:hypothetical protein